MSSVNYYLNIDEMPLYNWRKCQEGEVTFVRLNPEDGMEKTDLEAWDIVYNSFITKFGLSPKLLNYLRKKNQLTKKLKEYAISGDRFILNEINVLKSAVEDFEKQTGRSGLDDAVYYVSKSFGNFIDEKKVTVTQFYTAYYKLIEDGKKN